MQKYGKAGRKCFDSNESVKSQGGTMYSGVKPASIKGNWSFGGTASGNAPGKSVPANSPGQSSVGK